MSILSSETLFHFTGSIINLKSILKNEFYPRYHLESYSLDPTESPLLEVGVPMVSFCDIPLSSVKEHVKLYGNYGIGMSKDWAEKKGLNPVLYLYNGSDLSLNIKDVYINAANTLNLVERPPDIRNAVKGITKMFMFIKPFKGHFVRNGRRQENKKYYDEREWRYVPSTSYEEHDDVIYGLPKETFENQKMIAEANEKLRQAKLCFEPHDIKYIIVKEENEISDMVSALKDIKSKKYASHIIEILTSRIITYKQIDEDF